MNISYAYYDTPSPDVGVIAGTLGVWTLFDYGGEPGPWPTVSSSFGQFDYAGFPKSAAYWCTSDFFLLPLEVATCLTQMLWAQTVRSGWLRSRRQTRGARRCLSSTS